MDQGRPLLKSFNFLSKHNCAPIRIRSMPPPCYRVKFYHSYSAFFLAAALFGLAGASVAVAAVAGFLEVTLFKRALIACLFLETPKEPIVRFPFFDFLSPLPMNCLIQIRSKYTISVYYNTNPCPEFFTFFQSICPNRC